MEWDWADGFIRQHVMNKMLTLYNARWAVCVECVCVCIWKSFIYRSVQYSWLTRLELSRPLYFAGGWSTLSVFCIHSDFIHPKIAVAYPSLFQPLQSRAKKILFLASTCDYRLKIYKQKSIWKEFIEWFHLNGFLCEMCRLDSIHNA